MSNRSIVIVLYVLRAIRRSDIMTGHLGAWSVYISAI